MNSDLKNTQYKREDNRVISKEIMTKTIISNIWIPLVILTYSKLAQELSISWNLWILIVEKLLNLLFVIKCCQRTL